MPIDAKRVHAWRILNLGNTLVAATFAEEYAGSRSVSENVATHRLAAISTGEQGVGTRIALDLVCLEYLSTC